MAADEGHYAGEGDDDVDDGDEAGLSLVLPPLRRVIITHMPKVTTPIRLLNKLPLLHHTILIRTNRQTQPNNRNQARKQVIIPPLIEVMLIIALYLVF